MHSTILKAVRRRAVDEAASQLHTHRQRALTVLTQSLTLTDTPCVAGALVPAGLDADTSTIGAQWMWLPPLMSMVVPVR